MSSGLYFLKLELKYMRDAQFNTSLTEPQKWRFVQLNMLAKECNAGGAFIRNGNQLSLKDIAWSLHLDLDELNADIEAMKGIDLISENGHGPVMNRFVAEQETPKTGAERQAEYRERVTDALHNDNDLVTNRHIESESDIESDIESESEGESSVKEKVTQPTTDDIQILTDQKTSICKSAGIPSKYSKGIIANPQLTPGDLLAELTRNYSRKGKVKNPGIITGMNLTAHPPERPAVDWYDKLLWMEHLPGALKRKLDFVFQSSPEGLDTLPDVTTRNDKSDVVKAKVRRFMGDAA